MMTFRILWHNIRGSIWWRPLAWGLLISLLALVLLEIDSRLSYRDIVSISPWLYIDSAAGARTLLGAIATAMLTVATLAFSILMLAVVQTANAYSPRILREYLADAGNQNVLGVLIGVFVYALLVLRRVEDAPERLFLPMLSVSVGILLSLLAVLAFIYFINHVAHSIEVSSIVKRIYEETTGMIADLFPAGLGRPWQGDTPPHRPEGAGKPVLTAQAGYLEAVDGDNLIELLADADIILRLDRSIGEYVLPGTAIATIWPAGRATDNLCRRLQPFFTISNERNTVQDMLFGFQQLSDIALRALSPAVNDPRTAEACIHVMGRLLCELARRPLVTPYRCEPNGTVRLVARGADFDQALEAAYMPLLPYIVRDPSAFLTLLDVYSSLAGFVHRPHEKQKLWEHLWRLSFAAHKSVLSPWDRQTVNGRFVAAAQGLGLPAEGLVLEVTMPESYKPLPKG